MKPISGSLRSPERKRASRVFLEACTTSVRSIALLYPKLLFKTIEKYGHGTPDDWIERHLYTPYSGKGILVMLAINLLLFGPLMVVSNLIAQQLPFNAIFLVSDPMQKWRLFANFMLYFLPFLAAAVFLGTVFLKAKKIFGRVYFADLAGSGLSGLLFLLAMYLFTPENLIVVPLALWAVGSLLWFAAVSDKRGMLALAGAASMWLLEEMRKAWLRRRLSRGA